MKGMRLSMMVNSSLCSLLQTTVIRWGTRELLSVSKLLSLNQILSHFQLCHTLISSQWHMPTTSFGCSHSPQA
nr:hypothetical protein Iba_chr14bCG17670 [Ipomoea batatas]GME12044.1 hypothetical protein Iba_scaffold13177CG0040 [Ipomoea batatas]